MSTTIPSLPAPSVVLFVRHVAPLAHFYASVAQMARLSGYGDHVVLGIAGLELVIHGIPAHIAGEAGSADMAREDSCWKLCLPVPSIAAARPLVHSLGGRLKGPEHEWTARGFRACDGVDPEGNVIQLRESAP